MKYVIRKVPERDTTYLERLIPDAIIYNDVEHEGPIISFVKAMELANDDAVYVQDDMILCENFCERCNEICEKHRNEVVQLCNFTFFTGKTRVLIEGYYDPWETPWCLCVYIPKRISQYFVWMYNAGKLKPTKFELRGQSDDWMLARVVQYMGEKEYLIVPNLAGHPINKSTVNSGRDTQIRMCMNFEYDKAVPRGDMSNEIKYYCRNRNKYDRLREEQRMKNAEV